MDRLRIATYTVQNLFSRPAALDAENPREVLRDGAELAALLNRTSYEGEVGERIIALVRKYDLYRREAHHRWFHLVEARNGLLNVRDGWLFGLKAQGCTDWVGWLQWNKAPVHSENSQNTARIIQSLDADVVALCEVENRTALAQFNTHMLARFGKPYPYEMCLDGNDTRGIEIAMLSRFPLVSMRTHVFDTFISPITGEAEPVFSRDCAEYELALPDGRSLWLLINHFKSQGAGRSTDPASADEWREIQARRVSEILDRFDLQRDLVVVAGNFNEPPQKGCISPLLHKSGLTDVLTTEHAPEATWTHHYGHEFKQIDYMLVSQPLRERITAVGIDHRGVFYPGGDLNARLPEINNRATQASDHGAIWADFSLG
jgi:endonuclease/exonuclease/phosphatase family metal-dependent hydrolase